MAISTDICIYQTLARHLENVLPEKTQELERLIPNVKQAFINAAYAVRNEQERGLVLEIHGRVGKLLSGQVVAAKDPKQDRLVDGGYGEYLVYRTGSGSSVLDETTYERCYQVLLKAKQIFKESEKQEFLKREISLIDPKIKTFFIPRTLYELCFIEKCLKETLRLGDICENATFTQLEKPEPKCWHGASFRDFGNDQNPVIIDLARRLNNSIVRNMKYPIEGGWPFAQINALANEKLTFLRSCHEFSRSKISDQLLNSLSHQAIDITRNMVTESEAGANARPIGIAKEEMKKVVLAAIELECSEGAKGKFILYRGSKLNLDTVLEYDSEGKVSFVQSLSFGTGPFSSGMYDPGASPFYYMRKSGNDAIALLVPQEEEADSPFAIPKTHPLSQMFARGEKCHARSRAPTKGVDPQVEMGCKKGQKMGKVGKVPEHFLLPVTPQEFETKFQHYQKNCVVNLKA